MAKSRAEIRSKTRAKRREKAVTSAQAAVVRADMEKQAKLEHELDVEEYQRRREASLHIAGGPLVIAVACVVLWLAIGTCAYYGYTGFNRGEEVSSRGFEAEQ